MGEERTACVEKRTDAGSGCRHRHSSVISSCSEDAESESTSAGYPPSSPVEEREEELEYGPGIVNKLRTRFLTISLKQNRGIRRSCSMENLLEQAGRPDESAADTSSLTIQGGTADGHLGHLKRAKSMDTLLMEMQSGDDVKKGPKIVKRPDSSGLVNRLCDEELPKPDTVKTYKRMFEPAESRRGSHCRRPPVLRASAKSCAAAKQNVISNAPSAKVNGVTTTTRNGKFSAKSAAKAQVNGKTENGTVDGIVKKPAAEPTRPLYNGCHVVKASPVKICSNGLLRNSSSKELEKNMNSINRLLSKKETQLSPKATNVITNGHATQNELVLTVKLSTREDAVKQFNKPTVDSNGIVGGKIKPKVPPNRPSLKPPKIILKSDELKSNDKVCALKLKPNVSNGLKRIVEAQNQNGLLKNISSLESNALIGKPSNGSSTAEPDIKVAVNGFTHELKTNEDNNNKPTCEPKPVENGIKEGTPCPSEMDPIKKGIEVEPPPVLSTSSPREAPKLIKQQQVKDIQKITDRTITKSDSKAPPEPPKLVLSPPEKKLEFRPKADSCSTPDKALPTSSNAVPDSKPSKKLAKKSPGQSSSMVFDFRARKDVVAHVAVLPTPFGCKPLPPKKRLVDGKEAPSTNGTVSDEEDDGYVDYSVPPPSGVVFEGENVKIGRGSILSKRNKELKISFDDDVDNNTFVYPSENSLLDDTDIPVPSASTLKANTTIGTSGSGGLSTYTPSVLRTVDNFEPGMFRHVPAAEDDKQQRHTSTQSSGSEKDEAENTAMREDEEGMLKPADPELISSWSISAGTSDLLF